MIKTALYRLSVLLILYLIIYVSMDPLLRWVAVKAGESAFGAKVEIGRLTTGLFPPRLELKRVAVADAGRPMKNLVEFERAAFQMEGRPLLEKKFIVREAAVTGLTFQTDRKTSGALPKAPARPLPGANLVEKMKAQVGQVSFDRLETAKSALGGGAAAKVDVAPEDLETLRLARELQDRYTGQLTEWEGRLKAKNVEAQAASLKARFEAAQAEGNLPKKIQEFTAVAQAAKTLADETRGLDQQARADIGRIQEDVKALDAARARDIQAVMSRLQLPSLDAESLSRYLLGPSQSRMIATALDWAARARSRMPTSQPKPARPTRGKGVTVRFPADHAYPTWAVRTAAISGLFPFGQGGPIAFEGSARGITSHPALLGEPATISLKAPQAQVAALLDHRKEPATDTVNFSITGLAVGATQLGSPEAVSVEVTPGTAKAHGAVVLTGDTLRGKLFFTEEGMRLIPRLGPQGGGEVIARLVTAALRDVTRLEVEIALGGTLESPDLAIQSNLGRALADGLTKAVGREVEAQRKVVEAKIQALVGGPVGAIQKDLQGKQGALLGRLGGNASALKEIEKAIQDQIANAQKSLLGPGQRFDLKNIFK